MTNKKRLQPEQRKEDILTAAVELAEKVGFQNITRDAIADHAGVSFGLVTRYFGTMTQLKGDVMRRAIKQENLPIVADGIACRDSRALKVPESLRRSAVSYMIANADRPA